MKHGSEFSAGVHLAYGVSSGEIYRAVRRQ